MSRRYQFRRCVFTANDAEQYAVTEFFDGSKVPARPESTDSYYARVVDLGCPSAWDMCWQHEVSHTVICELWGLPWSPTLFAVAHNLPVRDEFWEEEEATLALQKFLNGDPAITPHVARLAHKLGCAHAAEVRGVFTEYLKARQVSG